MQMEVGGGGVEVKLSSAGGSGGLLGPPTPVRGMTPLGRAVDADHSHDAEAEKVIDDCIAENRHMPTWLICRHADAVVFNLLRWVEQSASSSRHAS